MSRISFPAGVAALLHSDSCLPLVVAVVASLPVCLRLRCHLIWLQLVEGGVKGEGKFESSRVESRRDEFVTLSQLQLSALVDGLYDVANNPHVGFKTAPAPPLPLYSCPTPCTACKLQSQPICLVGSRSWRKLKLLLSLSLSPLFKCSTQSLATLD